MKRLLVVLLAFAAGSAQAQPAQQPAGSFERIILDGAVQLNLKQGGERDEVVVMGDDDVRELVQIHTSGNRLIINTQGNWKFWNKSRVQVNVTMKSLSQLIISGASDVIATGPFKTDSLTVHISGAGNVRFDELNAGTLRFIVSGAGDGQISGKVENLSLDLSGKGKLQADQLRATNARVNISGVGNAQLWATDTLRMHISGVGTVDYWGQPQTVSRSSSGLATINARGDKR
jgi:hypothetical protein